MPAAKTVAPVTEVVVNEPAAPELVRPLVQRPQPEPPVTTAAIAAPAAKPQPTVAPARVETPRPTLTRPVVASAPGNATTTPSSPMRWQVGAAPAIPGKGKVRASGRNESCQGRT
jgi:hypothetical protein